MTPISAPMNTTSSTRMTGLAASKRVPRSLIAARMRKAIAAITPSSTLVTSDCRSGLAAGARIPPLDRASRITEVKTSTGNAR